MLVTNDSCINFDLPDYKRLLSLYGRLSSIEIINYLSSDEFINWYGYNMFPIITEHFIVNNKGATLDLRDKIEHSKLYYNRHLEENKNNLSEKDYNNLLNGKYYNKIHNRLNNIFTKNYNLISDLDINYKKMNDNEIVSNIVFKYLNKINRKLFKTKEEVKLLNGDININDYFGLTVKFNYTNSISKLDNIVTIKHKLNNIFYNEYKTLLNNNKSNIKNIAILNGLTYDSFYYDNTLYINSNNNNLNNLTFAKNLVKAIIYDGINISDNLFNYVKNSITDSFNVMSTKEQFKEALFFDENFNKLLKENNLLQHINSQLNTGSLFSYNKKEDKANVYTNDFITQQKLQQCLI